MGDRISISFRKDGEESVALFHHWGGLSFLNAVQEYLTGLNKELPQGEVTPLERREPETVMVDFIRWLTKDEKRITSDLYLGKNDTDGDNSDNGHHVIDL